MTHPTWPVWPVWREITRNLFFVECCCDARLFRWSVTQPVVQKILGMQYGISPISQETMEFLGFSRKKRIDVLSILFDFESSATECSHFSF